MVGFGQGVRRARSQPQSDEKGFQTHTHPKQKGQTRRPDDQGQAVGLPRMLNQAVDQFKQGVAVGFDAEHMFELARSDEQAGRRDKAGDHLMGQKIRQEAEAEYPHGQQNDAGQEGQTRSRRDITHGARLSDLPDSGGGH